MVSGLRKVRRKPSSEARRSSPLPSSVMATKWLPASPRAASAELAEVAVAGEGLQGAAGLGGDQEERVAHVDGVARGVDPVGDGGVEHREPRSALRLAEDASQRLRSEAAAAHAQQDDVADAHGLDLVRECLQVSGLLAHFGRQGEPAESVAELRGVGLPQGVVDVPDAANGVLLGQGSQRVVRSRLSAAQCRSGGVVVRQQRGLLLLHVGQQRHEGIGEGLDAVGEELVRDLGHADARGLQRVQRPLGLRDEGLQRGRDLAVIEEVVEGGRRHGVDGVGTR